MNISSRTELDECLGLVEELLTGPNSSTRPLRGLSFASCNLTADDFRRLCAALNYEAGKKLGAFGISKNAGVEQAAWHELFAAVPEAALWFDFGDNQLSDADLA